MLENYCRKRNKENVWVVFGEYYDPEKDKTSVICMDCARGWLTKDGDSMIADCEVHQANIKE